MVDGNEVLYYVSFEEELDKVDLEVLVKTSQPIIDDVVFEFPNGDCYIGNLTEMTPTLNRFTLTSGTDPMDDTIDDGAGGISDGSDGVDNNDSGTDNSDFNSDTDCCFDYEKKYNLIANQERVSSLDNTSFMSKIDGAI